MRGRPADLSAPDFDHARINGSNADLSAPYKIEMVSASGAVVAAPSTPDSFNVSSYATTCASPTS